jgi:hypothetical protein
MKPASPHDLKSAFVRDGDDHAAVSSCTACTIASGPAIIDWLRRGRLAAVRAVASSTEALEA